MAVRYNIPATSGFGPSGGVAPIQATSPIGMAPIDGGYLNSTPYTIDDVKPGVYFPHSEDMGGRKISDPDGNVLMVLNSAAVSEYTTLTSEYASVTVNGDFSSPWITKDDLPSLGIDRYANAQVSNDAILINGYNNATTAYVSIISTDNGQTWTAPTLSGMYRPTFGYNGADQFLALDTATNLAWRSADGITWESSSILASYIIGGLEYTNSGYWIFHYHPNNNAAALAYTQYSSDGGQTWTQGYLGSYSTKGLRTYHDKTNDIIWFAGAGNRLNTTNGWETYVSAVSVSAAGYSYNTQTLSQYNYSNTWPIAFGGIDDKVTMVFQIAGSSSLVTWQTRSNMSWQGPGYAINTGGSSSLYNNMDNTALIDHTRVNKIVSADSTSGYVILENLYGVNTGSSSLIPLPGYAALENNYSGWLSYGSEMWETEIAGKMPNGDIIVNAKLKNGGVDDYAIWKTSDFSEQEGSGGFNLFTTSHTTLN